MMLSLRDLVPFLDSAYRGTMHHDSDPSVFFPVKSAACPQWTGRKARYISIFAVIGDTAGIAPPPRRTNGLFHSEPNRDRSSLMVVTRDSDPELQLYFLRDAELSWGPPSHKYVENRAPVGYQKVDIPTTRLDSQPKIE